MNIHKIARDPRAVKALIGIDYAEFTSLLITFTQTYNKYLSKKKNRKRKPGGGQKGHLPSMEARLFFILFYIKTYPTFDVLAFFSGKSRGRTCEAVHLLLIVLKKTLGKEIVLPERKIRSVQEFIEKFPEVKDIIIDGTEKKIQRPKNKKQQKKHYSGKKKTHTTKNLVITDEHRHILVLSPTRVGKTHDKRILNDMELLLPPSIGKFGDTGFVGMDKMYENTVIPKKRSKKHPLTERDKENNRIISSLRVTVEHAIGGIKKFRVIGEKLRNRLGRFGDDAMFVCCGLHNFHLKQQEIL
jgi:hypothetical protein